MRDETNFLTKEQFKVFLAGCYAIETNVRPKIIELLFKVIYEGALRVSEAISLTPTDLIVDKKLIRLEATKGNKKAGGKREFAWVKDETFNELVKLTQSISDSQRIFPFSRQTIWRWARQIGEICEMNIMHENKDTTNLNVHMLRHSRAIHILEAGKPINIVQKKLRHRSLQPTTTYTRINIEKVREAERDI